MAMATKESGFCFSGISIISTDSQSPLGGNSCHGCWMARGSFGGRDSGQVKCVGVPSIGGPRRYNCYGCWMARGSFGGRYSGQVKCVGVSGWRRVVAWSLRGGAVSVRPVSWMIGPGSSGSGGAVGEASRGCLHDDRGWLVLGEDSLEAKHLCQEEEQRHHER